VRVGELIAAAVTLTGATEPVLYVDMRLAGTGYSMKMRSTGPGQYSYRLRVPPIVPPGTYTIEFYGVGKSRRTGPVTPVSVTVTA
jgi:hypothetical protein